MAISLTNPLVMQPQVAEKTANKIKIFKINWVKENSGFKMTVVYTDGSSKEYKSFDAFSRADCRLVMQRVENRMMNYPEFAGTQADDPDEA